MIQLLYSPQPAMNQAALKKLLKSNPPGDVFRFDLSEDPLCAVADEALSVSLTGERKTIIAGDVGYILKIKGISYKKNDAEEDFYDYLRHPLEDVDVYLLATVDELPKGGVFLDALNEGNAKISPVQQFARNDWLRYIPNYLKKRGSEIESGAIELLADRIGGDYSRFVSEADKLLAYADGGKITKKDVETLVAEPLDEDAFHLFDAILNRDGASAFEVYRNLSRTTGQEIPLLILLHNQFRFLHTVLSLREDGKSNDQIAFALKSKPYRVSKTIQKGSSFGLERTERTMELLYAASRSILKGESDPRTAFLKAVSLSIA